MSTAPDERRAGPAGFAVGDHFAKTVTFTEGSIRQFAAFVGDTNPLHHDMATAAAMAFGGLIASGTHTSSLMLAAVPDYFKDHIPNVGLEASVRMLRPVRAGDTARIEWEVTDIADKPKLKGWIVSLAGQLVRADGVIAMTAATKVLIYWQQKRF